MTFFYEDDVEKSVHEAMYRNGQVCDVFRNTMIRNCTIWNDWGKCLEIGAETRTGRGHYVTIRQPTQDT